MGEVISSLWQPLKAARSEFNKFHANFKIQMSLMSRSSRYTDIVTANSAVLINGDVTERFYNKYSAQCSKGTRHNMISPLVGSETTIMSV